ncbi:MAG: hypothetical protein IKL77_01130 [Clostridia bacterium]|nr:hypothetical protein [Clostridia bacterium]
MKNLRRDVTKNVVSIFKNVVSNALRLNKTKTKMQIRASFACPQAFLLVIASYGFQRSLGARRCHPEPCPKGQRRQDPLNTLFAYSKTLSSWALPKRATASGPPKSVVTKQKKTCT